jgi:hypothetical protein
VVEPGKFFMANYQAPTSPVLRKLLEPLADAYSGSHPRYDCAELGDLDFLETGVSRCLSAVTSGRDFLQQHADRGRKDIAVGLFFKALKSGRRLANLESVNLNVARLMGSRCADPLAGITELSGFDIYAGDGHFHEAACHDPHKPKRSKPSASKSNGDRGKRAKKLQTGHFFLLGMRDHHLRHHALAEVRPGGGNEHDMHALKRKGAKALRCGAKVGRKTMVVWDRACIDFAFWAEAKRSGVYFISREKANMDIGVIGLTPGFDRGEPRNAGVTADELVGPGGGGQMLRRVSYTDANGAAYRYLTTEMKLPAWAIVLLFKLRWDIEKVFDEVKNKLLERKSWASGDTAKEVHANFICLTHNLMVLLEDEIETADGTGNTAEKKRKSEREQEAKESGAGFIATAMQRITVRSVKFVRWLRNFIYSETAWGHALARLAKIYATR